TGAVLWAHSYSAPLVTGGDCLTVDGAGHVLVGGPGNLALLDATGTILWSHQYPDLNTGAPYGATFHGLTFGPGGAVYALGTTRLVEFDSGPGKAEFNGNDGGVVLLKLDAAGNFISVRRMGCPGNVTGQGLAVYQDPVTGVSAIYSTGSLSGTSAKFDTGTQ